MTASPTNRACNFTAILLSLLLLVSLSGCSGGRNTTDLPLLEPGAEILPSPFDSAPAWERGDWWTYAVQMGAQQYVSTRVVTAVGDTAYTIGVTDELTAFNHARSEISVVGLMRKSDLAGSQETAAVEFLQFPLTDGRTWTMNWDGLSWTATAAVDTLAKITYVSGNESRSMTYDPAVRWFTQMSASRGGEQLFNVALQDFGTQFSGDIVTVEIRSDMNGSGGIGHSGFMVRDGEKLWTQLTGECGAGTYSFTLTPANDPASFESHTGQAGCVVNEEILRDDPVLGDWFLETTMLQVDSMEWRVILYAVVAAPFE